MKLHLYHVVIVMADGSKGDHQGQYQDGFDAVIYALENFPDARRISARRIDA